jgi:hypothetical protein
MTLLVSYLCRRMNTLKFIVKLRYQHGSSLRPEGKYCIIGLGVSRMRSLWQSVGRRNADRSFAIDSADTTAPHQRFWILIDPLVEG